MSAPIFKFVLLFFVLKYSIKFRSIQCTPTIIPADKFDPKADADKIYEAIKDLRVIDDSAIRAIMVNRVCQQRMDIKKAFKEKHNEIRYLDELISTSDKLYYRLLNVLHKCDGRIFSSDLFDSINDIGTDEKSLILILVAMSESPQMRQQAVDQFREERRKDMTKEIKEDVSGDFKSIVMETLKRDRQPSGSVDTKNASEDAQKLIDEMNSWSDNRNHLDYCLLELNFEQFKATEEEFKRKNGKALVDELKNRFKKYKKTMYVNLATFLADPPIYFAIKLHDALSHPFNWLHDYRTIMRIIVSRSERDLVEIENAYLKLYKQQLRRKIQIEYQDRFKDLLVGLLKKINE